MELHLTATWYHLPWDHISPDTSEHPHLNPSQTLADRLVLDLQCTYPGGMEG